MPSDTSLIKNTILNPAERLAQWVACLNGEPRDTGFDTLSAHTFVKIEHEIFSRTIPRTPSPPLPLIQEGQLPGTGESVGTL